MEFRNSIAPTGVDIPGAMVDWVVAQGADQGELDVPGRWTSEVLA